MFSARHASTSDSDSEYGSRSHKKKKRARSSGDEVRTSSRGGKVPNYYDDVEDFEQFDAEDVSAVYPAPNAQYEEEDEIEAVLSHSRDEGRENDPEDLWFENVVCVFVDFGLCVLLNGNYNAALPYQMEEFLSSS